MPDRKKCCPCNRALLYIFSRGGSGTVAVFTLLNDLPFRWTACAGVRALAGSPTSAGTRWKRHPRSAVPARRVQQTSRKPQGDYLTEAHREYPGDDPGTFRREAVPPVPFIQPGLDLFHVLGLIMSLKDCQQPGVIHYRPSPLRMAACFAASAS
jgi:hypothetical protein